jgi:adenine-specific DNA-methyltransferase
MDKENIPLHKKLGIFYTPQYIIDFILSQIFSLCAEDNKNPANLSILDPSCGNGLFLKSVLNKFAIIIPVEENIRTLNNIYGVDIDRNALMEARNSLQTFFPGIDINPTLSKNIICGNSIIDDKSIDPLNALDWSVAFPLVMENGGFDIIIGNPPWVALKGKQSPIKTDTDVLDYFFSKYNCDKYRPNLFELFIWKSIDLLKQGGYLGFIIPDRICSNEQYINLRKFILETMQIKYLWLKPEFENVISDNVVIILKKEKPELHSKLSIAEYPSNNFVDLPQINFYDNPNYKWTLLGQESIQLFNKIRRNPGSFNLAEKFHSNVGFISRKGYLTNNRINDQQIPVIKGGDIQNYLIKKHHYFDLKNENIIGGSSNPNKLKKKNKVFLRKTGRDLIASFDDTGLIPEQSVYFIYSHSDDEETLIILSAILNSTLMNYYYHNFAITNKNSTPQLKKMDLDEFPILIPENRTNLLNLSYQIYDLKKSSPDKIEDINKITQLIDSEINIIYGLTEEEINLIYR